ncbi:hypothetical protein Tsp_15746, partial [Trichinella spiralis]|uniref:hypothetical protein n=1 Tax=Trichinella spiralis TaxID=6334 RepID=UPI0001EFD2BF
ITSSPELLWSFICFGHRDKSCSDHFVLNVASVSIEFAPDCSCIVQCTHFIHDSITLASSEYDIFSDGALTISLSQPSSVRAVTSSHEACIVGTPCSHGHKGVFLAVPVCLCLPQILSVYE